MTETSSEPYGPESHDKAHPNHSGECGHYYHEFDGLWICKDCSEAPVCTCFGHVLREETAEERREAEELIARHWEKL